MESWRQHRHQHSWGPARARHRWSGGARRTRRRYPSPRHATHGAEDEAVTRYRLVLVHAPRKSVLPVRVADLGHGYKSTTMARLPGYGLGEAGHGTTQKAVRCPGGQPSRFR